MSDLLSNKQLRYLFLCNFAILFIGMGLFPLLPLYAAEFGADSTMIGIYLALTYISISVGTMSTSWLAQRWTPKGVFLSAGLAGIPALILLGQASALWQVVVLTAVVWFSGGVGLAMVGIFTGLYADQKKRGKAFSLMSLGSPLGAILGGIVVGQMVDWQGYAVMFVLLSVVWSLWPAVALFKLEYRPTTVAKKQSAGRNLAAHSPDRVFYALMAGILLSSLTVSIARLGLSLSMKAQQFAAADVSGATAVGGLVALPVALGIGSLSDRLGRKRFLALGYLAAAAGALALGTASQLWQYWLASSLLLVARSSNGSVSSALATDLLSPDALGLKLPWLHTMSWVASVLGFAGAGYGMASMGGVGLFLLAATFSGAAAGLLGLLPGQTSVPAAPRWKIDCFFLESSSPSHSELAAAQRRICLARTV